MDKCNVKGTRYRFSTNYTTVCTKFYWVLEIGEDFRYGNFCLLSLLQLDIIREAYFKNFQNNICQTDI